MRLDQVTTRPELENYLKDNADSEQGRLARFELARLDLVEGVRDLGSLSRAEALKRVRQAAESYEKLAAQPALTPQLAQEALLNAAKARETLGDFEAAKEMYARLAREYPQSLKGKAAEAQLKALQAPGPDLEELKLLAKDADGVPGSATIPAP
jgi:hypothetical protein